MALDVYLWFEKVGLRRRYTAPRPVISVGNLSVGGTGKTPVTAQICAELKLRGYNVVILSRGHGAALSGNHAISDENGSCLYDAQQSGDEPFLLAKLVPGVPVVIGKDRRKSVKLAMERFRPDIFVMDDGFQYWQLARDFDIVLLDTRNPICNGFPLPRGLLREPKKNMNRADAVLLTRHDAASAEESDNARRIVALFAGQAAVHEARHAPQNLQTFPLDSSSYLSTDYLVEKRVFVVSGIARPDAFHDTITGLRAIVCGSYVVADHHVYTDDDLVQVALSAHECRAEIVVTTAKDAVKWNDKSLDSTLEYLVLNIAAEVTNLNTLIDSIVRASLARKIV